MPYPTHPAPYPASPPTSYPASHPTPPHGVHVVRGASYACADDPFPVPGGAGLAAVPQGRARHRDETSSRSVGKGVVATTSRTMVVVGLVAGGYTQMTGATTSADAPAGTAPGAVQADPKPAAGSAIDVAALPGPTPAVEDAVLLRQAKQVLISRARAAAAKAKAEAAAKARALAQARVRAEARARAVRNAVRDPRAIAKILVSERGWSATQFGCLDALWTKESGWNYRATNPTSGAFGIPQALPGSKMASAGADWRTNPVTQIKWGLSYIADIYSTPCGAWTHSKNFGWY